MSQTNGEQSQSQYGFTEGPRMNVANPVILLVGKTGSGKSTLGNLLLEEQHDDGTFYVSADMESVTQVCGTATMSIDGINYNIVDTPGIFDTQKVTDEVLNEIARAVQKCAYGVKAILFVFEARRFTDEQRNVLEGIRKFLGEGATNYIIAIFSHATKTQINDRNVMRKAWNQPVRSFINEIENRWGISPNSDYFPPDHPIHKARLGEIKAFISGMRGVYTTELLEKSRQEQEEARRQKEEEERRAKQEYEDSLKDEARKESQEAFKSQLEELNRKHEEKMKYEDDLKRQKQKEAEEQFNKEIERMRQEQQEQSRQDRENADNKFKQMMDSMQQNFKEQQEREDKLRKEDQQKSEEKYNKEIEEMKRNFETQNRQKADDDYKKKLEDIEQKLKAQLDQQYQSVIDDLNKKNLEAERRLQEEINKPPPSCFSLDNKVQLASGKFVEMAELQVGDRVCSNIKNGELEFSEVYLISHIGHHDYPLEMTKIEFTNSDGQKGQIRMTSTHCVFNENLSILYAQDLVPGETKILVLNKTNELVPVIVDNLIIEKDTGYISFYTRAGTVITNNVLCSCYDYCPQSQALMDLVFAPIRLWTKVFPSNHRQKELHPYVKILETAYFSLCNTLNIGKWVLSLQ